VALVACGPLALKGKGPFLGHQPCAHLAPETFEIRNLAPVEGLWRACGGPVDRVTPAEGLCPLLLVALVACGPLALKGKGTF
jgi:hypothetical protein